jgi:hypothetical protein
LSPFRVSGVLTVFGCPGAAGFRLAGIVPRQ